MSKANQSCRVARQFRTYGPDPVAGYGAGGTITATVRYDDHCNNGHNTFSLTANIHSPQHVAGGSLHNVIVHAFPELAPLVHWHLVGADGPMHYIPNTLYWLGYLGCCDGGSSSPPNLEHARKTACWPDMPEDFLAPADSAPVEAPLSVESTVLFLPPAVLDQLATKQRFADAKSRVIKALEERLPALLAEFRAAVESLGFVW